MLFKRASFLGASSYFFFQHYIAGVTMRHSRGNGKSWIGQKTKYACRLTVGVRHLCINCGNGK